MASIAFTDAKEAHGAGDTSLHTMTGWSRGRTSCALADNSLGCMGMNQTHKGIYGDKLASEDRQHLGKEDRKTVERK